MNDGFQYKQTRNIELYIFRDLVAAFAHSSWNYFSLFGLNETSPSSEILFYNF